MPKVLIVDDDFMLADDLEDVLVDAGYSVCGIANNVADAIALGLRHTPDLGVIDVRLSGGESGTDIARALRAHHRFGVLFATGTPERLSRQTTEGEACLAKPFLPQTLVTALGIVAALINGRPIPTTLPRGLVVFDTAG